MFKEMDKLVDEFYKNSDEFIDNLKTKHYCTCTDSSVCCPGDITTLHCDYCGNPTRAVLESLKAINKRGKYV